MSEVLKPKKVKFVYSKPEDYKIYPVNGAWGGPTARDDIIVHFFVEQPITPKEEVHSIKEDGSLSPLEREQKEEAQILRELQVGIVVNPEQALTIAKWLQGKVNELKKMHESELKKQTGESQNESA